MNPSFMAMMGGIMKRTPSKGKHETSINGRAFAPGKGVQQETGPAKEAKVRAHLDKLAEDVKERCYPRSDMVKEMEEKRDAGPR